MRFLYLTLSALAAVATAATNSNANPFNIPKDGYTFEAGEPTTLTWAPSTDGTVSLRLQWGAVLDPKGGTTIASGISNSGSFTWTPPSSLAAQPDYTIEIIDDSDSSQVNYLPRFTVTGATSAATTSTAAKTTSTAESSTTEEKTTTAASTKTHTTLSSVTSPSSSAASTTAESSSATNTASQTTTDAATSTSASASETTVPNTNAGMANRVSGGMLAVILGAVAVL